MMPQGYNANANQPSKDAPIQMALVELEKTIEILDARLGALENKMRPVLHKEEQLDAVVGSSEVKVDLRSDIELTVIHLIHKLGRINEAIENIMFRVDL